mgnify:CR=1 FL=1
MGRRDYEGAPIEGVRGNVAGSTTSDYGSRNFTGSERFEFNNEDDSVSVTGPTPRPPKTGLTKAQFENRFGITDRNPYGQTGFAKFFDKFSKALGGKGVDYSQQFRDLDRLHNRRPGRSQELFRQQQYGLYRNPDIDESGKITSGGIDQLRRGTFQGPVEQINREMGTGEQLVRAGLGSVPFAGSFLSGLGTDGDLYLSSRVTDEMRARENPSLAEQLRSSLGLGDTIESIANKGSSLIERMQGIVTGQGQPSAQDVIPSEPAMGSMDPSREIGPLAQTIPTPIAAPIAVEEANPQGPMMPAEFDQRLDDNTVADMLRESRVVDVPTPTSRPNIFDSTLIDQVVAERQEERDRAAAQREANRDKSLELLPGMLNQAIADSEARKMAQTEELDSVAPPPEMTPAEMLREIISQPPSPRTGGQAQVAELDIPSIADLLNSGLLQDLLTEQGPNTSIPLGGGTLNFRANPNNPGIEFRRQLQGKDMGAGEFLSFLNRITS